jgi:hypothetical protein
MRKPFTVLIILFHTAALSAQEKVDLPMMQKIRDEALKNSQIPVLAHYLTDVCGPRLTNSPGYRKAVAWSVQTLKQWGLVNAAPEPWGKFGKGWSNEQSYLAMTFPYYHTMIAYPAAWASGTEQPHSAKVLMINNIDSATIDKAGENLKGKIVLLKEKDTVLASSFTPNAVRYEKEVLDTLPPIYEVKRQQADYMVAGRQFVRNQMHYLQSKGAVAMLFSSGKRAKDGTTFVTGGYDYADTLKPTLPVMIVSTEDCLRLQRFIQYGQEVVLDLNVHNKWYSDDLTGYNVIAEIPGTDPKLKSQVVMLGGHLDSWHTGTGATDNAAGCVVMMEAVRILKAIGVKPRRTIRIALWGGEEQGLLGSFGYVKKHFGDPKNMKLTQEQGNVSAYFNLDAGTGKIRGVYLQNNEKVRDLFKAWLQPFADLGATGITNSNIGSTDHLSFDAVGIPGFQFIQDPMEYRTRTHHSNMDVYDHLAFEDLQQAATIVAAFVYNAAMRDEMLPRKPLPKPEAFLFDNW